MSTTFRPGRGSWLLDAGGIFTELILLTGALVAYWLGLHLTRPSPLTRTSGWQLFVVGAYGILIAVVAAVLLGALALTIDRAFRATDSGGRVGTLIVKTVLAATLVLLFMDNLLYSLIGASLRNEEGSPAKVAFLILALSTGLLWGLRSKAPSRPKAVWVLAASAVLTVGALATAGFYLADEEEPSQLVRVRSAPALNVLILSTDGINSDAMSVYTGKGKTTPFLESISGELLMYDNAFANNGNTTGSIVSLLTGRSPEATGVVYPPDALQQADARLSLPYLLGPLGYRRSSWAVPHYSDAHSQNLVGAFDVDNGHEASPVLDALPTGSGAARWFVDDLTESSLATWADMLWLEEMENPYDFVISTEASVAADEDRLNGLRQEIRSQAPFFINSHFMVSHGPFFRLPEGRMREEQSEVWQDAYYRASIRVFDAYVKQVFEVLRRESKLESTVVVVTSDHGQQYDARQRVPLLIRFPGGGPSGRSDVNAQRLDIAPTILRQLGFEPPGFMRGDDLAHPDQLPPRRHVVALTVPTRHGLNNLGFRPSSDDLVRTTIECRRYEQVLDGDVVDSGTVPGSTARCAAGRRPQ